jgi:Protein of unknown function (DUF1640)
MHPGGIALVDARFSTGKGRKRRPETKVAESTAHFNSLDRPSDASEVPKGSETQPSEASNLATISQQVVHHGSTSIESMHTHQFDTYKLVSTLEQAGYSHRQAVALMKCLRALMVNGTEVARSHYLSRGDLENVSPPIA